MTGLTLEQSSTIVDQALEKGRELKLQPLTVVVLDAGGQLKAMKREDRSSLLRPEIAMGKAWGVLGMGFGGREFARRAAANPTFLQALMVASGGRRADPRCRWRHHRLGRDQRRHLGQGRDLRRAWRPQRGSRSRYRRPRLIVITGNLAPRRARGARRIVPGRRIARSPRHTGRCRPRPGRDRGRGHVPEASAASRIRPDRCW
jgi:hypothetical protein